MKKEKRMNKERRKKKALFERKTSGLHYAPYSTTFNVYNRPLPNYF